MSETVVTWWLDLLFWAEAQYQLQLVLQSFSVGLVVDSSLDSSGYAWPMNGDPEGKYCWCVRTSLNEHYDTHGSFDNTFFYHKQMHNLIF